VPAMFCPRCGKPNEEGARYCSACGEELPELGEEAAEATRRPSLRARMGRLIGRNRRERQISAGIAIALVVAIVAVIAISTGGSEDTDGAQSAYVEQADRICIESKQALAIVGNRVSESRRDPKGALALYAGAVAEIAADWRSRLAGLDPPPDSKEASARLDEALAKLKDEADEVVVRAQAGQNPRRLRTQLAAAGSRTQQATDALGLEDCAEGELAIGRLDTG
jgi:zinc-ribbon domain